MAIRAKLREVRIRSWTEFVEHPAVAAQTNATQDYLFRGQANFEHGLIPSHVRPFWLNNKRPSAEEMIQFEEEACEEFISQEHLYAHRPLLTRLHSDLDWWMYMRHFLAPSRVLDWTRSAYVAAYFACEKDPKIDGAVWAVNVGIDNFEMCDCFDDPPSEDRTSELDSIFKDPDADASMRLIVAGPRNERMVAQQGVFLLCENVNGNHSQVLLDAAQKSDIENGFVKLRIPAKQKPKFFLQLRAMNINARSIYPGLDGLGKSITEMMELNAFPD